jgi:hypothetical protein
MRALLELSLDDFDALWLALDGRGAQVKVDRLVLWRLLRDHAKVLGLVAPQLVNAYPPAALAKAAS